MTSDSAKKLRIAPSRVHDALHVLHEDMSGLKSRGSLQLAEVQDLAGRLWKSNLAVEHRIAALDHERKELARQLDHAFEQFDALILPLWKFDEDILPIYSELGMIRAGLASLSVSNDDSTARAQQLVQYQERLNEFENAHIVDTKFVADAKHYNPLSDKIPPGQAMCSTLLNQCHRLIQKLVNTQSIVDVKLSPIEHDLEDLVSNLSSLRDSYRAGLTIDPAELLMYQQQARRIDNMQKDGKFIAQDGSIPEGQAAIHELLEWSFDLIHECVVLFDSQESEDVSSMSTEMGDVRNTLMDYAKAAQRVSGPVLDALTGTIKKGVEVVGNPVLHPIDALGRLRSLVISSLGFASSVSDEPVPENLKDVESKFITIRKTLKDMRNERNEVFIKNRVDGNTELLARYNKSYVEQLGQFKDVMKILDEKVKANGNTGLETLSQECFCRVVEMLDESSI